ncbi:MAG TPA: type I glutamate--ammonia ligase [Dictyobacter sp.]|jgi:glutamine synthetase|nr:type I glutamate--ammonia ligase [Dictyobacter sp.]
MAPEDVLKLAKEQGVKIVDFKFTDLPGTWQHFSVPAHVLTEDLFSEGLPFDGSSVRGFQTIDESDMMVIPDASTAFIDPFTAVPTLSLTCNIAHPGPDQKPYSRDPRYIAQKAEEYLRSSGIADTAFFGPEAEFYIFDNVRYASKDNKQYAEVDSDEAHWNSEGRDGERNLGHLMNVKGGYFPVAPSDTYQDLRSEMVLNLEALGITVEAHHHEVGAPGQAEIDYRFGTLVDTADKLLLFKYVIKNTARKYGKSATFMPKPVYGDNGSGMHTHQSLWKAEKPLFYDADGYAGLSQLARFYIGGILTHAPAVLAIAASSTNSFKRLVPGFEAPVNLVYSSGNRSAAVRIPKTESPKAKRVEFRPPDPTANPYLLFSALLMAGLDGIRKEIDPSKHGYGPVDRDLYSMTPEELREISSVPGSLDEALNALENDHDFLLEGDVFTPDVLEKYIELKREQAAAVRLRPAPIEFSMYYDA